MNPPRLQSLQTLRALAALMVLIGHVIAEAEHYFGIPLPGDAIPWTRGVDIFFVISGFVITASARRFARQPFAFLRRRALRVVPLYYFFTTLMVATLILLPGGAKDTALDPAQILSSYGFFPYARADGRIAPVLSLGWTLNYEMFFYALFALCLALPAPLRMLSALILCLATLGWAADFANPQLRFWTNPIILEFLFGVGLARLYLRGWHWPNLPLCTALMAAGFALLIALDPAPLPRFIAAGMPAAMIVGAGAWLCPNRPLPWQTLGDASYAIYLSHRFALRGATLLLLPLLPANPLGTWIYVTATCGIAILLGIATHRYLERPFLMPRQPKPLPA
ncbi:MAG: acyltransferase family protein [Sulfitobacter sp.]